MDGFTIFSAIVLGLTITAFIVKSGMLFGAGIAAWLVESFLLWNQTWPTGNTFFQYAVTLFGIGMVIVMVAATLIKYVEWHGAREPKEMTNEDYQADYRQKVYKKTHKSKWYEK